MRAPVSQDVWDAYLDGVCSVASDDGYRVLEMHDVGLREIVARFGGYRATWDASLLEHLGKAACAPTSTYRPLIDQKRKRARIDARAVQRPAEGEIVTVSLWTLVFEDVADGPRWWHEQRGEVDASIAALDGRRHPSGREPRAGVANLRIATNEIVDLRGRASEFLRFYTDADLENDWWGDIDDELMLAAAHAFSTIGFTWMVAAGDGSRWFQLDDREIAVDIESA